MNDRRSLERGERIYLRRPSARDEHEFLERVRASRTLHRPWTSPPSTSEAFHEMVRRSRRDDTETLFACRIDDGTIAGVYNLSQIFRGPFDNAFLGYYAFAPSAGKGFMSEALPLVLRHAFGVLGLHRVEANVQPDNVRSVELVRRCGFRLEGYSPRYLRIAGRWRDHQRWAITSESRPGARADAPLANSDPVELREVSSDNWREVFAVRSARDQMKWVAPTSHYLASCRYTGTWNPLAVYVDDEVVGFLMWGRDPEDLSYWLGGIVIDRHHQGKGYGRATMRAAIAFLRSKPGCREIALSYRPENLVAKNLYSSIGFRETGETEGTEVVARLPTRTRRPA